MKGRRMWDQSIASDILSCENQYCECVKLIGARSSAAFWIKILEWNDWLGKQTSKICLLASNLSRLGSTSTSDLIIGIYYITVVNIE